MRMAASTNQLMEFVLLSPCLITLTNIKDICYVQKPYDVENKG